MSSVELTKGQSSTAVIPDFLNEKVEGTKRKRKLCLELSFWPATSFIRKGYKKPIQEADMWRIDPSLKGEDNWAKFEPHWKEELKKPEPSLIKALGRSFGSLWGYAVAFQIFYALQGFAPAILLPYLVDYIKYPQVPIYYGFVMVAAIFLAQLFNSFLYYHSIFLAEIFGLKVRNVLIQLIYRKSLLMVPTTESSSGQVVNLMSTDAQTLAEAVSLFNMGVVAPIQIILAIALIWLQIGPYALISIGVVIVVLPFNLVLGKKFSESRTLAQRDTDERVKLTNELLQAVRIVKYYAWEAPFARNIIDSRKKELVSLKRMHVVRSLMIYSLILVPTIGIGLTFIAYSINNNFDVSTIFTTLALLNQMKSPLIMLPVSLAQFFLMKVSLDRILKFAKLPELPKTVKQIFIRERNQKSTSLKVFDPLMEIVNGEFAWDPATEEPTMKDINFQVRKGQLVMVVGPVGSGKSSLGLALLGEINKRKGEITLQGTVAYAGQQAWIINGTVRDNILFGLPYDEELYKKVIKASALEPDLAIMPAGDKTEIGSRGINLSGGQRQRISIARAVYSQRDCYIFDDPLSAVDAHVGRHIFESVMMGLLKGRNILLITNQLQYLPHASNIYVLSDGAIVESGKYIELVNNGKQFASLMEKFGIIDDESDLNKKKSKEEEERTVGVDDTAGKLTADEDKETGFVSKKIWGDYIKAGGTGKFIFIIVAQLLQAVNTVVWNWWLSAWSIDMFGQTNEFYLGMFVMFLVLEALLPLVYYLLGVSHSIAASGTVHDEMLQTIIRSPTTFFDTTPLGRILGRFSKDMYVIDILLPAQLLQYMTSGFSVLSIFALLCVGSYFSLVAIVPAFVLYFFMQVFYRKTSIEVQRIESVSRSPIFSHFTETLGGVSTIRAYNLTDAFKRASMQKVNRNTRDFFQQRYIAAWFGMRLDWIGTLIVLATYLAIVVTRTTNAVTLELAVLALSNTASLTLILNAFNINSTETEMRMNSVERVVSYIQDLDQEAPDHIPESSPPQDWPQHGQVELKDLTVAYANSPEPVLKGLSATIKSREKVGIVGRTGAGKSTMLTSLFRMVEPSSGTIVIDGVDITKIGLFDLRSKLSIIPQEPTLFIGTVRYNLDPFNEYTDKEIWDALDLVKLKEAVEKLPEGLWSPVSEGGSNFSVGQRQLLCMARALLKKANVLLLDEATASVDIETDSLIQKTVRKYFADCTVLTIAHRLNTIMDSTRIMVLDKGQLVEFDTPGNLIRKQDGYFRSMIEATGPASAEHLKQLAIGEISVLESIKARMKEKQKSTRQIRAKMHALARSETSASQSTAPASNTNKEKLI